jgi:hypothetical protein
VGIVFIFSSFSPRTLIVEEASVSTCSGVVMFGPASWEYPHFSQMSLGLSFKGLYLRRVPHFGQNFNLCHHFKVPIFFVRIQLCNRKFLKSISQLSWGKLGGKIFYILDSFGVKSESEMSIETDSLGSETSTDCLACCSGGTLPGGGMGKISFAIFKSSATVSFDNSKAS